MPSNPQVTSVKIQDVPSWVDLTFVADCLNGKYSNLGCIDIVHAMNFDVTAVVKLYLDQGSTIPANSQNASMRECKIVPSLFLDHASTML